MSPSVRGRLPASDRRQREDEILTAAQELLTEKGYARTTMLDIARRAGASKETLYAWYGTKEALFGAICEQAASDMNRKLQAALTREGDPREVLVGFGVGLLRTLLGSGSLAMNRAAMQSDDLAAAVLRSGRYLTGPLVESYLAVLIERGYLRPADPGDLFQTLYGLLIRDLQIRALLGDAVPEPARFPAIATAAVAQFLNLAGATIGSDESTA